MTDVAISILSSDFLKLGEEIVSIEAAGADWIHVDVMDGHFVSNITFGPDVVKRLKEASSLPLDVHLMMAYPEKYIERFAAAGAEVLSVHYEACKDQLSDVLQLIKRHGCKPGVVINPTTDARVLEPYLDEVYLVLQMTVEPGFGGQSFIEDTLSNIRFLRNLRYQHTYNFKIEVDGGVNEETAIDCVQSGVDMMVVGSYFIHADNRKEVVEKFKKLNI